MGAQLIWALPPGNQNRNEDTFLDCKKGQFGDRIQYRVYLLIYRTNFNTTTLEMTGHSGYGRQRGENAELKMACGDGVFFTTS